MTVSPFRSGAARAFCVALAAALAACAPTAPGPGAAVEAGPSGAPDYGAGAQGAPARIAYRSATLVTVEIGADLVAMPAPEGTCIFPRSIGVTDGVAHLSMGACRFYTPRAGDPVPVEIDGADGLATVTLIDAPFEGGPAALEELRRVLTGPNAAAAGVEGVEATEVTRDALFVFAHDGAGAPLCRAYTRIAGRMATVALRGAPDAKDRAAAAARLMDVVRVLRAANPAPGA